MAMQIHVKTQSKQCQFKEQKSRIASILSYSDLPSLIFEAATTLAGALDSPTYPP